MPPQRTPLGSISGNRMRGEETKPYTRGKIVGMHMAGAKPRAIREALGVTKNAIKTALKNDELKLEGASKPRPGQPYLWTDRDDRTMLRSMRIQPKLSFEARRKFTGLDMSNSYQRRLARAYHIRHWVSKIRPELTEKVAQLRLEWCRVRQHWGVQRWREYIWSDECSAERGKGKERVWVWGIPADKWKKTHVETKKNGKQLRIMVWACFWGNGQRCPLYIMDRDFESKKYGYSANSYLEVLNENLSYIYDPAFFFMHDNAPIHTTIKVRDWFIEHGVIVTDWPPYSPDLNPIEHAWKALKEMVHRMHSELWQADGESEEDRTALEEALKEAWDALPDSLFESLVQSMEARIAACIKADGWHTKY